MGVDLRHPEGAAPEFRPSAVAAGAREARRDEIRIPDAGRAVLPRWQARGFYHEEMELCHKLSRLSEDEQQRLEMATTSSTPYSRPGATGLIDTGIRRSMPNRNYHDDRSEQVQAWAKLAEPVDQDNGLPCSMREDGQGDAASSVRARPGPDAVASVAVVRDRPAAPCRPHRAGLTAAAPRRRRR